MLSEQDWDYLFEQAKLDGGMIVSKVGPPSGAPCDHKESPWVYHRKTVERAMAKHNFRVAHETKTYVSLQPVGATGVKT